MSGSCRLWVVSVGLERSVGKKRRGHTTEGQESGRTRRVQTGIVTIQEGRRKNRRVTVTLPGIVWSGRWSIRPSMLIQEPFLPTQGVLTILSTFRLKFRNEPVVGSSYRDLGKELKRSLVTREDSTLIPKPLLLYTIVCSRKR